MTYIPGLPGKHEIGRLNIASGATLPMLVDCRICAGDLHRRKAVVYCPRCDHLDVMTTPLHYP